MYLKDVRTKADLEQFYKEHNLIFAEEKANYLFDCMGLIGFTGYDFTPEEELSCMEQYCLESWNRVEYIQHE